MSITVLERADLAAQYADWDLPGTAFTVHPDFEPVPLDANSLAVGIRRTILVTGVDTESDSGNRPNPDIAELYVGRIITATVHQTSRGNTFYVPSAYRSRLGDDLRIPAAFLYGSLVHSGMPDSTMLPDDSLVALSSFEGAVWKSRVSPFERGLAVTALALEAAGTAENIPTNAAFNGATWVKVTRRAVPEEEVQAGPFSFIPEGLTVSHTADAVTRLANEGDLTPHPVYITRTLLPEAEEQAKALVGKVIPLRASSSDAVWFIAPDMNLEHVINKGGVGNFRYFHGALVNSRLINGETYLLSNGQAGVWVNSTARFVPYRQGSHRLDFDNMLTESEMTEAQYVRVETPGVNWEQPVLPTVPAEAATPEPGVERTDFSNTITSDSPLLGMATEDRPVLNPELVPGKSYLAWRQGWSRADSTILFTYIGSVRREQNMQPEELLVFKASLRAHGERRVEGSYYGDSIINARMLREGFAYVEAAESAPVFGPGSASPAWERAIAAIREHRNDYISALNELASEKDWCGEYEQVMRAVGFPGRTKKTGSFNVEVSASFTYTNTAPSSTLDTALNGAVFDNDVTDFEMSELSFSASATVTVYVQDIEYDDNDDLDDLLRDHISNSDVEDALNNVLGDGGSTSVSHWSYESHDEA